MPRQTGPLTFAQLQQLWIAVTDPGYSQPFLELGEGRGYEAFTQAFAQFARVSQAVDATTQGMFILNWSGQTAPPAAGASRSAVTLDLSRTADFEHVTTLDPGFVVMELQVDFAPEQGLPVLTGRRYVLLQQVTFGPGETGPFAAPFLAQNHGAGYDNPLPGTLTFIVQPGSRFENDRASVVPGVQGHRLVTAPRPDVILPTQVGQYVHFTAGANAGQRRRIVGYGDPTLSDGGTAVLAPTGIYRIQLVGGAFLSGEVIEQGATGAQIRCTKQVGGVGGVVVGDRLTLAAFATGTISVGLTSGAVAVFDAVEQSPDLTAENKTAAWMVLDWATDLGVASTNQESPTGGASATLDELLQERGIWRRPGEGDESYRLRGSLLADVVAPNAILRAGNRIVAPLGGHVCLREVGYPSFRGVFFDGDPESADPNVAFAFDLDSQGFYVGVIVGDFIEGEVVEQQHADGTYSLGRAVVQSPAPAGPLPTYLPAPVFAGVAGIWGPPFESGVLITGRTSGASCANPTWISPDGLQPRDAFKLNLDYREFRGFFLLSVPSSDLGEFGMAFDAGPSDAFDASPWFAFFDGFGATASTVNSAIYSAVDQVRAGGVGFDLIEDPYC